jgi:plastocyanin
MRISRKWRLGLLVALMGTVLVTGGVPTAQESSASTIVVVRQRDNFFKPKTITIHVGDRVRWVNRGSNHHTTTRTRRPARWDSGDMPPGTTFARTFMRVGTFRYFCKFHRLLGMRAKIVVVA